MAQEEPLPGKKGILDRKFLQEVLQRALITPHPSDAVNRADLEVLLEVARDHRGQPFGLEPVAVELVEAALKSYFQGREESAELLRVVSREIAESLFEDPVFQERLRVLWARLCEAI